eukprot:6878797-Prymnesium_polylepis.1
MQMRTSDEQRRRRQQRGGTRTPRKFLRTLTRARGMKRTMDDRESRSIGSGFQVGVRSCAQNRLLYWLTSISCNQTARARGSRDAIDRCIGKHAPRIHVTWKANAKPRTH